MFRKAGEVLARKRFCPILSKDSPRFDCERRIKIDEVPRTDRSQRAAEVACSEVDMPERSGASAEGGDRRDVACPCGTEWHIEDPVCVRAEDAIEAKAV